MFLEKTNTAVSLLYLKPTHELISKHTFTFTFIKTLQLACRQPKGGKCTKYEGRPLKMAIE
jgi:hypothetical protein